MLSAPTRKPFSQFSTFYKFYTELYTKTNNKKIHKSKVKIIINQVFDIFNNLYITDDMYEVYDLKFEVTKYGDKIISDIDKNVYAGKEFKKFCKLLGKLYFAMKTYDKQI